MEGHSLKKYTDPRWNDTTLPEVIGSRELTEEEKERERLFNEKFKIWLKERDLKKTNKIKNK